MDAAGLRLILPSMSIQFSLNSCLVQFPHHVGLHGNILVLCSVCSFYRLACNAFIRTNHLAIWLLPWGSSVCLSGTGMHRDHTVHFSTDISLWLDSAMFWAPWHQSMSTYSQPFFSTSSWKRGGVWMCKLGVISQERLKIEVKLLLSAHMPCRLAQQRMTLGDLEWLLHASCAISADGWASCSTILSCSTIVHCGCY